MNTRRAAQRAKKKLIEESDSSSDDESDSNISKKKSSPNKSSNIESKKSNEDDGSSSDSSMNDYLKPAHEIDFNSPFFDCEPLKKTSENVQESKILSNIDRLSNTDDSDGEFDEVKSDEKPQESTETVFKFDQIENFQKQLDDAKEKLKHYDKKISVPEESLDISQLLAIGENAAEENQQDFNSFDDNNDEYETESSSSEMEEVKTQEPSTSHSIPREGIQVTIDVPNTTERKKKSIDAMAVLKRKINRVKKEYQIYMHKVHLLCWIAHGNYVNSILNDPDILGLALSLIPSQHCYPKGRIDLNYLEEITEWFYKSMKMKREKPENLMKMFDLPLKRSLQLQINKKEANTKKNLVLMFICMLRSLGIQCRLVLSFRVLPFRPPSSELCSLANSKSKNKINDTAKKTESDTKSNTVPDKKPEKESKAKSVVKKDTKQNSKDVKKNEDDQKNKTAKAQSSKNIDDKSKQKTEKKRTKPVSKSSENTKKEERKVVKIPQLDGQNDTPKRKSKEEKSKSSKTDSDKSTTKRTSRSKKVVNYNEVQSDEDFKPSPPKKMKPSTSSVKPETTSKFFSNSESGSTRTKRRSLPNEKELSVTENNKLRSKSSSDKKSPFFEKKLDVASDIINLVKNRIVEQKQKDKSKLVKNKQSKVTNSDSDSDYAPESITKKKSQKNDSETDEDFDLKTKYRIKSKVKQLKENDRRVLSTDEEPDEQTKKVKIGTDAWVEVFLEDEEKWTSVDVTKKQVHCVQELYSRATHPVSYIVAWNNDNTLKDITSRYCKNWNTVTRKLRVEPDWWIATLKSWTGKKTARDKEEDEELAKQQLDQPLPNTINEYKNHPLYVLKRHLLKFEAIFPPEAPTLGFVRNEPVYARECVYTLHSRETWVKQARVVKPGEKPYKIVKARPKYDKLSGNMITDIPLEVFGPWQTKDYEPPVAENGMVPRNAYGNVELFKACMLPKGTVHLQLPALNKVARKLGIDCAPAMIGFDYHSGGSHPMYDGFVVCEEFKDTIVAAWEQEQVEAEKRAREKIEKRVYDNWKKLIKGLLIRERLKVRYNFGDAGSSDSTKKKKAKGPRFATKKRRIYDESESD